MIHDFDVALSFAGADRPFVAAVVDRLRAAWPDIRVFYDADDEALWGQDMPEALDAIYRKRSRWVVLFISRHYAASMWTRRERHAAIAGALEEQRDKVLPARFDDTDVPGLFATGWIDLRKETPESFADKISRKIRGDPSPHPAVPSRPRRRTLLTAASAVLLAALAAGWFAYRASAVRRHHDQAAMLMNRGDADGARRELLAVLAIDEDDAPAHANLAHLLGEAGEVDEAIRHARAATHASPGNALYHYNLGNLLAHNLRDEEAQESLRRAIALDPRRGAAYNELGKVYLRLQRPAEAEAIFRQGIRADPAVVPLYKNLGQAMLAQGHVDEAIAQLQDARRRSAEPLATVETLYWLAEAYRRAGRVPDACASLREIQQTGIPNPWSDDIARPASQLHCEGGA